MVILESQCCRLLLLNTGEKFGAIGNDLVDQGRASASRHRDRIEAHIQPRDPLDTKEFFLLQLKFHPDLGDERESGTGEGKKPQ